MLLTIFLQYYNNHYYEEPNFWEQYFSNPLGIILGILQWIALLYIILYIFKEIRQEYHSNWNHLLDDFTFSTYEFYKLLSAELMSNNIEGINIEKVKLKEGNLLSSRRLYLRVVWKEYQFDICAAPFGKGFFISWWLLYVKSKREFLLSKIPWLGKHLVKAIFPITYYKIDTASMFMTYAQSSVQKVIEDITQEKGIRPLTQEEKKPVLNDIFHR